MVLIKLNVRSTGKEVSAFLCELRAILNDEKFNIDTNFKLIKSKKEGKKTFSTPYTLIDLEYDTSDVVDRLKELTVKEYSETLIDKDDLNPPLLFIFGKSINGKQVYIKLKIKNDKARHVLCVSFHYAERQMHFPY